MVPSPVMALNTDPLVSAVVPTYGRPKYLVEAIESVVAQTYDPLELIVVDDCSPDPIEPRLSAVDMSGLERVVVHRHDENRGANAARNTALNEATGKFVAFLDDDDYWRPEKVARQVATFRAAADETGVVYTGLEFVDEAGTTFDTSTRTLHGDVTRALLCGASIGSFTRLMIRTKHLDAVGGLDEALPGWQDRDLNLRLSTRCRFEPVQAPLAVHRRGTHDQIGDDYEGKRDRAYPRFVEKHRSLAAEYGPRVERRFLAAQTVALANAALINGHTRAARQHLFEAIRYDPTYWYAYACLTLTSGDRVYHGTKRCKQFLTRALETVTGGGSAARGDR